MREEPSKGFTIIEVLIVVAILGVLAAIAIPQVTKYTTNARRADGKTALLAAAQAMERYYTNNCTLSKTPGDGCGLKRNGGEQAYLLLPRSAWEHSGGRSSGLSGRGAWAE